MSKDRQETIADIIEEKRSDAQYIRENNDTLIGRMDALKLEEEAGRIEAAWKREREAGADAAQICGKIGEMVGREAACKQCNRLENAAKMREALEQIHELLSIGGKPDTSMCIRYEAAYQIAEEALSAPPRNCDVGTEKEQDERFRKFCTSHYNRNNVDGECDSCPLKEVIGAGCEFAWSQLPYEEGGAK